MEEERNETLNEQEIPASSHIITTSETGITYRVAGFWMRVLAYLVDFTIVSALSYMLVSLLDLSWRPLTATFLYIGFVGSLYFILLTKWLGQTVGKILFGLKVVRQDGAPLDWVTVLFREGVGRFLSQYVLHLGYIWTAFHPKKKGWHDLVADTYVVYDPVEEKRMQVTLE